MRIPEEAPLRDDRALVAQSLEGDSQAFAELLRRHDAQMRGVVWRVVESASAMDDVLQDAYLKAWRSLDGFRGDAAFSSWLYRIVYTTAIDHVRARSRRPVVPLETVAELSVDDASAAIVDSDELRSALAALPADQLAVVSLVDGQGESYERVAALLEISAGTVASRLSRGRATLRKRLRPKAAEQT